MHARGIPAAIQGAQIEGLHAGGENGGILDMRKAV